MLMSFLTIAGLAAIYGGFAFIILRVFGRMDSKDKNARRWEKYKRAVEARRRPGAMMVSRSSRR